MLPVVATPRLQMKVRTMIRPNKASEIRSIGSSTRSKGASETADIKSNARWFDLQENRVPQRDRTLRLYVGRHRLATHRAPPPPGVAPRGTRQPYSLIRAQCPASLRQRVGEALASLLKPPQSGCGTIASLKAI